MKRHVRDTEAAEGVSGTGRRPDLRPERAAFGPDRHNVALDETLDGSGLGNPQTGPPRVHYELGDGTQVNQFLILQPAGRGGMGSVYMAYDTQLQRRVALKFLRSGAHSDEERRRALHEAQLMAKMNHPNVVTVYETGEHDGHLYIAMEWLNGVDFERWNASNPDRPWKEAARILLEAANGLRAAHLAGVIHRDFKPSNVFCCDNGRVVVTDFGLAVHAPTMRETSSPSKRELTTPVAGTPRYMSPETWRAEPCGIQTDQFGFCVTLYEAIFGRLPFDTERHTLPIAAARGRYVPMPSQPRLPTSLREAIEKDLAPDPEDRNATLDPMIAALRESVGARKGKRLLIAVAAISAVLAATGGVLWGRAASNNVEDCAAIHGNSDIWTGDTRAAIEKAYSDSGRPYASTLWKSLDSTAAAWAESWSKARVRLCQDRREVEDKPAADAMESRLLCLQQRRKDMNIFLAHMRRAEGETLDRAVDTLMQLPTADSCLYQRQLEASRKQAALPHYDLVRKAQSLGHFGQYEEALDLAEEADAKFIGAGEAHGRADALAARGFLLWELGRYDQAEKALLDALGQAELSNHLQVKLQIWGHLVLLLGHDQGRLREAEVWARLLLSAVGDKPTLERARALYMIAAMQRRAGRTEESILNTQEALNIRRNLLSETHTDIAETLNVLTIVYLEAGELDQAEKSAKEALKLRRELLGDGHPDVISTRNNLGNVLVARGQVEEALEIYDSSLKSWREIYGEDHPEVAVAYSNIGNAHFSQGRYSEAARNFSKALAIETRVLGRDHFGTDDSRVALAVSLIMNEDYRQALDLLRASLAYREKVHGENSTEVAELLMLLGESLLTAGSLEESESMLQEALRILKRRGGDKASVAKTLVLLHRQAKASGDKRLAADYLSSARTLAPALDAAALSELPELNASAGAD